MNRIAHFSFPKAQTSSFKSISKIDKRSVLRKKHTSLFIVARRRSISRETDESGPPGSPSTQTRARRNNQTSDRNTNNRSFKSKKKEPFDAELVVLFGLPTLIIIIPWAIKDPAALALIPVAFLIPGLRNVLLSVVRDLFVGVKRASRFMNEEQRKRAYTSRKQSSYSSSSSTSPPPPPPPGTPVYIYDLDLNEFTLVDDYDYDYDYDDGDDKHEYESIDKTSNTDIDLNSRNEYREKYDDTRSIYRNTATNDQEDKDEDDNDDKHQKRRETSTLHPNKQYSEKKRRWVQPLSPSQQSQLRKSAPLSKTENEDINNNNNNKNNSSKTITRKQKNDIGADENTFVLPSRQRRYGRKNTNIESRNMVVTSPVAQPYTNHDHHHNATSTTTPDKSTRQQSSDRVRRQVPWYARPIVSFFPFFKDWGGFMEL